MTPIHLAATGLAVAALALPAAAADEPGTFRIPGTDTTARLSGFVESDVVYDLAGADENVREDDWASFLEVQPLDRGERNKKRLYLTSRTSRLGLLTTTPTGWGTLTTRLEGDFNSPSPYNYSTEATTNGTTFRLRHAYGELGPLLVGQTWSNFMDLGSLPDTVDFNPHGAFALTRQPMIRWTFALGGGPTLAVAAENPQDVTSGAVYPDSVTVGRYYDRFPDLTANLTVPFPGGHLDVRGVALEYAGHGTTGDTVRRWGYGAGVSGSLRFAAETLVWSVQGGNGIGRYLFTTLFQGGGLVGDRIALWRAIAYHVGLTHAWSATVRSNVVWTQTFIDDDRDLDAVGVFGDPSLVNRRVDALFANTFVSPVKGVDLGLEYVWGRRLVPAAVAVAGNDTGTQHRLNALARYSFF